MKGMARLTFEDIEKLGSVKDELCISIFLPTHRYGQEVNNKEDMLAFKSELQKISSKLSDHGHSEGEIKSLLKPAYELLNNQEYWRHLQDGLAVYISKDFFSNETYPVSFELKHFVAREFIITPLLPLLVNTEEFYILNLDRDGIDLYKADQFNIQKEDMPSDLIPKDMKQVMKYFEFEKHFDGKPMPSAESPSITTHGHRQEIDQDYKYLQEYLNEVSQGLDTFLGEERIPLVLAGGVEIQALYRNSSHYSNIHPEGVQGNFSDISKDDLHKKAWSIIKDTIERPMRNDIKKYEAWAGTGKTSYDLHDIYTAVVGGRVESICIDKCFQAWGNYNEYEITEVHQNQHDDDMDLTNTIAYHCLAHNGKVIPMNKEELPEKEVDVHITAVYRY